MIFMFVETKNYICISFRIDIIQYVIDRFSIFLHQIKILIKLYKCIVLHHWHMRYAWWMSKIFVNSNEKFWFANKKCHRFSSFFIQIFQCVIDRFWILLNQMKILNEIYNMMFLIHYHMWCAYWMLILL